MTLVISDCGIGKPSQKYSNEEIAAKHSIETSDEWIYTRTGIKSRYLCSEDEDLLSISVDACKSLKIDKERLSLVIVANSTNRKYFPSVATYLHQRLGLNSSTMAFDINDACNGFVQAFQVARSLILNTGKCALVVGVDQMSQFLDWTDRSTCVLFGDAAGAIIFQDKPEKLYYQTNYTLSKHNDLFTINPKFRMDGKEVFKIAIESMSNDVRDILNKSNLNIEQIKYFIPHQANERITKVVGDNIGIAGVNNIKYNGNTSAATIPLALYDVYKEMNPGDRLLMTGFGAGLRGGSVLIEL